VSTTPKAKVNKMKFQLHGLLAEQCTLKKEEKVSNGFHRQGKSSNTAQSSKSFQESLLMSDLFSYFNLIPYIPHAKPE
jgi:hypothetical protein